MLKGIMIVLLFVFLCLVIEAHERAFDAEDFFLDLHGEGFYASVTALYMSGPDGYELDEHKELVSAWKAIVGVPGHAPFWEAKCFRIADCAVDIQRQMAAEIGNAYGAETGLERLLP